MSRSSVYTVVFPPLSTPSTTFDPSTESRKFPMKDRCVTCYGVIPMIDAVGV